MALPGTAIWANPPPATVYTTLAGAIGPTATSLIVAAGTGAIFPNPASGQFFAITMRDAATGLLNEIMYCTARSGDTLSTLLRGQEGTTALSWSAGDLVNPLITAGELNGFAQSVNVRTRLNGAFNLYVAPTGSDANNGLTAGTPFLTLQRAITAALNNYDVGGLWTVTINLATGTYAGGVIQGPLTGSAGAGSLVILGNASIPADVVISATNANCILAEAGAQVLVSGVTLTATGPGPNEGNGIYSTFNSLVGIGAGVVFGACANAHISAVDGGDVISVSPVTYQITGGATYHNFAQVGGIVNLQACTCAITGTPSFTTFAYCDQGAIALLDNTYTGSASGQRYNSTNNGVIRTGGLTLPGSSAGTTSNGGLYS